METAVSTPTTSATPAPVAVSTPTSGTTTTATSTPTPAERPKTFAEAFANDAASQTSKTSTAPDGATTLPVEAAETTGATPLSTDPKAPPVEKWPTILENARTKAAAEAQATFDRDYGWAKQVPRESLEKFSQIATSMTSDPVGFINQFISEVSQHPAHAAQLRSQAGRLLASARGPQAPAAPDLTPDVQITDESGRVVGTTFSAEKVKALLEHSVQEQIAPLQEERAQRKAESDKQIAKQAADQKAAAEKRAFDAEIDDRVSQVTDHLGIEESTPKAEVDAMLAKVNALMDANPRLSAARAAAQVARQMAQGKVLENLKTKAAAQAVNPAGAVVATTSRPRSFLDKSLKW